MRSIHNVFHFSLIKPYKSDGRTQPPPAPDIVGDLPEFIVDTVLRHRWVRRGRQSKLEFMVRWLGYGPEHNTWEEELNLENAPGSVADYWQRQPANVRLLAIAVSMPCAALAMNEYHFTAE